MKRDKTIDIIRVFGLLWVMLIHSIFWVNFGFFNSFWQLFVGFLLFEMPVMFFVAGASNAKTSAKTPGEFYKKRFLRILMPYLAYLLFVVVFSIIVNYFRGAPLVTEFIKPRNWYNFYIHNLPIPGVDYLMSALWFVPIYLIVVLIFPWLKRFYDRHQSSFKQFLPLIGLLGVFTGVNLVTFRGSSLVRMVSFYAIWMYAGLFYERLNFKSWVGKGKWAVLSGVLIAGMLLLKKNGHFKSALQYNKFPPTIFFLVYSIAAMVILYVLSSWMIKWFNTWIKKSQWFKRIFQTHNKRGYTIYLYHPLSVIGANLIFAVIDPKFGISPYAWFRTLTFFVIMICLNLIWAKLFGWIEDIDYQVKLDQFSWQKTLKYCKSIFFKTYHYIVIGVMGLASFMMIERETSGWGKLAIYMAVCGGLMLAANLLKHWNFQPKHEKAIIIGLASLAFSLRIGYVLWSQTIPYSDYKVFLDAGLMIGTGNFSDAVLVKYISVFKHILGYASVIGAIFAIFGQNIMAVWVANCLLASTSVVLIYVIASKLFSKKTALIAGLALAVFPSYIAAAPLLFQGNVTIPLFLLALYFYLCSESSQRFIYLGLTLAILEIMRPVAIVMLIAIILNELILRKPRLEKTGAKLLMLLIPFIVIPMAYYRVMSYTMKSDMAGLSWFTIFVGMSDRGHWNLKDAGVLGKYMYANHDPARPVDDKQGMMLTKEAAGRDGAKRVQEYMRHETIARMRTKDYSVAWAQQKIYYMWASDTSSVYVLRENDFIERNLDQIAWVVNLFYIICVVYLMRLAIAQLVRRNLEISFLMLFLAGFIALHIITEVAFRYHFMVTPLLALALGLVLSGDYHKTQSDQALKKL